MITIRRPAVLQFPVRAIGLTGAGKHLPALRYEFPKSWGPAPKTASADHPKSWVQLL